MTAPTVAEAESLWLDTAAPVVRPALHRDLEVHVAVLGGGITGLTTALLHRREGARVAVLEARTVGSGVTGCNTAKVTALQSTVLSTIAKGRGQDAAAVYAEASSAGVEKVAELARDEGIECALDRRPAFTYAAGPDERAAIESEARAAERAGLPVELVDDLDLPYPVSGAVRLDAQIEFQPTRYARGLADRVDGDGSHVFEGTRALGVETGSPCRVRTTGGTVTAAQVVDAAHYPLFDRGVLFARLKPERSYCIAARIKDLPPQGLSISAGATTRSIRSFGDLLVLGGEGHEAGSMKATPDRYARPEEFAPCHGSRFDVDGAVLEGPATAPLERESV